MPSVAVVHPDPERRRILAAHLSQAGFTPVEIDGLDTHRAELALCDAVLCDVRTPRPDPQRSLAGFLRDTLRLQGTVLAVLPDTSAETIARTEGEDFDDFILASADAPALTARLRLALRARNHQRDLELRSLDALALLELSQTLASSLDVQTILHEASLLVASVLQVDRCAIVLLDPDSSRGSIVAASEDHMVRDLEISLDAYPELRNLIETSAPVIIHDASQSALLGEVKQILAEKRVGAEMLFPIIYDEHVVGALFLRSVQRLEAVDPRKVEFGMTVASSLGVSIRNARLFDSFRDHTKRVNQLRLQAERRMRALQRYEDFFEYAADGMMVLEADGRVQYLNREGHRILGGDRDREASLNLNSCLTEDSQLVLQHMLQVIRQGQYCRNIDLTAIRPSDEERSLSVSASPLGEGQGLAVLSFRDVTELKEMQTELKTTKDFLENLIDSSVDGIVAADLRGNVLLFNKGAERIYGYNAPEVIGHIPVWRLYPRGEAVAIMRQLRSEAMGGLGRAVGRRSLIKDKQGTHVPVSLTASIIYEDGVEVATVGIFSDLRDRLRMEQDLEEAQQLVIQSEKHAAVVELAGAAAHELNQPLTSVVGYAEMLRRKVQDGDPLKRPVDIVYKEAERMAEIVRKLGRITKYETKAYGGGARILDLDRASTPDRPRGPRAVLSSDPRVPLVRSVRAETTSPARPAATEPAPASPAAGATNESEPGDERP
ncbi:MAG: PAS domain S-box protein [Pseudomonadota bacterium]